jgi:carotenoid cleavage dioxygenase
MPPEPDGPSRFLDGPFAPVTAEITAFNLPVTGQVPAELCGRYLRNGPNPLNLDDPRYHWFVGDGMVHGVRLRDGKAEWYRNRWVRSRSVSAQIHEEWPAGPVHENFDFAANTHVIFHGGRTLATVEAGPLPYELSYQLDSVGPCDFGGTLLRGPHQARPAYRRTACDRLLLGLGLRPAHRDRCRRAGDQDHQHPGRRRSHVP